MMSILPPVIKVQLSDGRRENHQVAKGRSEADVRRPLLVLLRRDD
jgi:hypothetical protein